MGIPCWINDFTAVGVILQLLGWNDVEHEVNPVISQILSKLSALSALDNSNGIMWVSLAPLPCSGLFLIFLFRIKYWSSFLEFMLGGGVWDSLLQQYWVIFLNEFDNEHPVASWSHSLLHSKSPLSPSINRCLGKELKNKDKFKRRLLCVTHSWHQRSAIEWVSVMETVLGHHICRE